MQAEIEFQLCDLEKQHLLKPAKNCLFVGSGDSHVAGLAAQHLSAGSALCFYPPDIIQNPALAIGRNMFVVSISGSTRANIHAAKIARRKGARTTSITARLESRLAKTCDRIVELKYRCTGVATAGTISFMSSMLACISLAKKTELPTNLDRIYKQAEKHADYAASRIGNGTCFILGDEILYPAAMYGALKFNEVFSTKAFPYPTDEFFHSPLFSLKEADQVIIMGKGKKDQTRGLDGFSPVQVDFGVSGIGLLLQSVFFMQLVLKLARRRGLAGCYFLENKELLKASSDSFMARLFNRQVQPVAPFSPRAQVHLYVLEPEHL
jgi:fructoselysine-6-P-deglycase FrlB-like protein